jgi:hypothetical protein
MIGVQALLPAFTFYISYLVQFTGVRALLAYFVNSSRQSQELESLLAYFANYL